MEYSADLLVANQPPARFHDTLKAFVAPVAKATDAVASDPVALRVAQAVYAAFGDSGGSNGMTRSELAAACSNAVSVTAFESRFDLFVSMGLLRRYAEQRYQQRYMINPVSVTALLVYGRLEETNGVEEIMFLLDRAHRNLDTGTMTREALIEQITIVRRGLSNLADHLLYLAEDRPWEELVAEQSQHRSAQALLDKANSLVGAAGERFPELLSSGTGRRLVDEALRYFNAVNAFYSRLLAQASASRDFSMLSPEQYLSAALNRSKGELAVPLTRTVFDPASMLLSAEGLVSAVEKYRPAPPRRRPPRPPDSPFDRDPVTAARERQQTRRVVMEAEMELHLQGGDEADLTGRIRGAGWRGAARIVTNALLANADPDIPVAVGLSDALIVDAIGPVSHVTPMTLRRIPAVSIDDADATFTETTRVLSAVAGPDARAPSGCGPVDRRGAGPAAGDGCGRWSASHQRGGKSWCPHLDAWLASRRRPTGRARRRWRGPARCHSDHLSGTRRLHWLLLA